MKKPAIIGLLIILAVAVLIVLIPASEPRYNGRTLTSWLQQYSEASMEETQRLAEARQAVLAIGPRKALPRLVTLAKTKDEPIDSWVLAKTEEFRIRFLHWRPPIERQLQGIAGFEILETNAAPAVPELTRLLGDKKRAFIAARCLENIGPPAKAALFQCLTNENWQIRELSVFGLASATDDVEVYLALLKKPLKDSDTSVRVASIRAIGLQANAPELAVPLLITASEDSDDNVAAQAVMALSGFGTNAENAFATLTNLVNAGKRGTTRAALQALVAIAPARAAPVLSNAVVNGSPETIDAALKNLKPVAPALALRMTLDQFQSPDPHRRQRVISVALGYDMATPGIAVALKSAAGDADPGVAEHALTAMKQMLQEQKENANADVQIPNEPSYQGMPLGEWLKMHQSDGGLPTNAVNALREMGTNVIPALLARLTYKDPVFGLPRFDISMGGVTGLISLGDRAVPALPALGAVMDSDDQDLAIRAMMATLGTGTNAWPCLIKGLTSRHPDLRHESANTLSEWGSQFPKGREMAVFLLRNLLTDPDREIRMNATNQLTALESEPTAKAKAK